MIHKVVKKRSLLCGVVVFVSAMGLAGCKTPSEKYGLSPIDKTQAYPSTAPRAQRATRLLTPEEQAATTARLERDAQARAPLSASRLRVREH